MPQDSVFDELEIKLMAMTDEQLSRYDQAVVEYAKNLDPDSPKLESTMELLRKVRAESERRHPAASQAQPANQHQKYTPPKREKPKKKKKKKGCLTAIAVFFVCVLVIGIIGSLGSDDTESENSDVDSQQGASIEESQQETPAIVTDIDTTDYLHLDASILFEYGSYLEGQNVVTVITVSDTGSSEINANTDNDDSYFFSISCEFDTNGIGKQYNDGDILTVCGTVGEGLIIGSTVNLESCSVIGTGEIAQELKDTTDQQIELCQQFKASYEEAVAAAFAAEKEAYTSSCETVEYSDVARNPDNYKGKKVKISGEVIQVSEGFLNSVTLRVSCNGDIWYVTYTRGENESRILEGDQLNAYGECDGITTYTSVLGAQVTIPSMKMEYYD